MKGFNIEQFTKDYLTTAAWVTCDSGENKEFTKEAVKYATFHCAVFIGRVVEYFGDEKGMELLTTEGNDLGYLAAHDLFLTRNGHGAGFFDKTEYYGGEVFTDKLTSIAKKMGEVDCYHVRGPKSKLCFD